MFIIMIIIFLNELKNLTLSFLKINYLKDVADINIQKHCNYIYCEAETGRFNLAKNSFDLLLPNDNFNTKTYYHIILFTIILLFIDLFYKFWKYNDRFVPYLSNVDGEYFITYLKAFPFILLFLVVFILTIMIIRRYAPTSTKGYKAYFNTNNDIIPDEVDSYNINVILEQSKNIIVIFVVLYIICGFFSDIPSIPYISRIDGINYFYFAMAYIFILLLCFYMMVNIINITMTFTDNDKPNLEYINLPEILKSEVEELNVLSDDEIISYIKQEVDKSLGEMDADEKASIEYVIHKYISNIFDNAENIDYIFKNTIPFNGALIDKLILSDSTDNKKSIYKFLGLNDNSQVESPEAEDKVDNHKYIINIVCNLTKVLIKKDLANEHNKINVDKIDKSDIDALTKSYNNYMKEKRKVKLFYGISKLQNDYNKKEQLDKDSAYNFIGEYKVKLEKYKQELENEYNLYLDNPKIFKDTYEVDQTYTVDISYNSKNKYYENYFKISNGENIQLYYNVGNYQIKNMEGLLSYIIMFIVISLVLLLIVYNITFLTTTFNSYNIFTAEVISPLFILFIFVLFIYIFINYNTKYNLHFVNGIFDSSYKRDLTHLNNKIIPFIKLHDKNADELSNDYLDHYIITNIFTSIINGNLILYKIIPNISIIDDPLKIKDNFVDYVNISNRKIQYKLYNEVDTSNKVDFDSYYRKLFDKTYYYFEGNNEKYDTNTDSHYIYNLVKYIETNKLDDILNKNDDIDSCNIYIYEIIDNYRNDIIDIIYICKHIFDPNNFKKEIATYNDNINDGHENKLMSFFNFELTENKMEALPYKFLLNLNTKLKYDEFLKYKGIFKISDNIETNIAKIVDNFLLINSHMKYNYEIIEKYINNFENKYELTDIYKNITNKESFNEKINNLHNYENKRLFGLLKESLYKNDDNIIIINDTFRPTYQYVDDNTKMQIDKLYQTLKYNYNMLNNYNSNTINITNNYLKNVIKTIYKEINNEDIKFTNDSSDDSFKINIGKSDLAKPDDTILHKANNVVSESLFINYITNIIIIIIMYNIGNNI